MSTTFDLFVIGSGPGGQKAAIQAAKLGKRVGLAERGRELGGVSVNSGTIPSKTIREAVVYLTGLNQRGMYGQGYRVKEEISLDDLMTRMRFVVERERAIVRDQLLRNHVTLLEGTASFSAPGRLLVSHADGSERQIEADKVVIASGSRPDHPESIEFNGRTVLDSDDIVLRMGAIPSSLVVVGAGVIGIEFASLFAALGTKVTVVDGRRTMLDFCDEEVVEALSYHLRDMRVTFRFGEVVTAVDNTDL
jgi:NAD(P) transhydrogenase